MQPAPQQQRTPVHGADARTVATLNHLLQGEIAATETYTQAIARIGERGQAPLQDNLDCHLRRVQELRERIGADGGTPVDGSGMWGAFARLVEGSAVLLGRDAALAALEEGEDRGLRDYREALDHLDSGARAWVETRLLPAQVRTHAALRQARHTDDGPGPGTGSGGIVSTLLMTLAVGVAALLGSGCDDERKIALDQVTPEARSTIVRLAGSGEVTGVDEVTMQDREVAYDVTIARAGRIEHYRIDGNGLLRD